ncbi:VWA domain-containing protein [Pseudaquabacterium pictum]|uniref:VWA domain-containing protein n=1 Tax=Pseudaquabacterium pictum TaxID=2315236 RepID=UPI0013968FAD|nr:VWA domain-containing protein [Rubrivivax pictus]
MRTIRSTTPPARWPRLLALAAGAAVLAGCGGGGGADEPAGQVGVARLVVRDAYGVPVAGASVLPATAGATAVLTDSQGVGHVAVLPGTQSFTISVPTFVPQVTEVLVSNGVVTTAPVTLQRATAAAGGALATRSGVAPQRSADGRSLVFEVELVVVGADAQPVTGLVAGDFQLLPCMPDAATAVADCLRQAPADHAYQPDAAATSLQLVPALPVAAHTVGLLIDQSGSIADNDPLNARLYATKALISTLATGDQALLGAFARGPGARLPLQPLTLLGAVPDAAAAPQSFPALDALAGQSGGQTPLHDTIDAMRLQLVASPLLRTGLPRALVVFTDGADTDCAGAAACATRRQQVVDAARADGVRLFTIGLSGRIDVEALSHLATAGGGAMLYAETVEQLIPLYGSLGKLMSLGLPTYRLRFSIDAGQAGVFAAGQTVLARARVQLHGQTVDIPLAISLP